jgi:RNA-directed DNA polymerase
MSDLLKKLSSEFMLPTSDLVYLIKSAPYRYKVYEIPKRAHGGMRVIAQPARELKPLQYWAMHNVLNAYPIHSAATAYRKDGCIYANAHPHAANRFLLKMDFKDFFPSIKSEDFKQFIFEHPQGVQWNEQEIEFLTRILFWKRERKGDLRLSIGAPSSPMLSNILLHRFDEEVSSMCATFNVVYTRYADDLSFSTNRQGILKRIEKNIPQICTRLKYPRLLVNRKKTVHVSKKGARRITGLILTNEGHVSIGREKKRLIRAQFHRYTQNSLNEKDLKHLAGFVAYVNSVEPLFLERLVEKYGYEALERLLSMKFESDQ